MAPGRTARRSRSGIADVDLAHRGCELPTGAANAFEFRQVGQWWRRDGHGTGAGTTARDYRCSRTPSPSPLRRLRRSRASSSSYADSRRGMSRGPTTARGRSPETQDAKQKAQVGRQSAFAITASRSGGADEIVKARASSGPPRPGAGWWTNDREYMAVVVFRTRLPVRQQAAPTPHVARDAAVGTERRRRRDQRTEQPSSRTSGPPA